MPSKLPVAQISSELIHARCFHGGEIVEFAPLSLQQLLGFCERRRTILKRLPARARRVVGPDRVLARFDNWLGDLPARLPSESGLSLEDLMRSYRYDANRRAVVVTFH